MKEGLWLYSHDIDPYAGGVFRHVRFELNSMTQMVDSFTPVAVITLHLFDCITTTTYHMGI